MRIFVCAGMLLAAVAATAPARAQIGVGVSITEVALRTRSLVQAPPSYIPGLDFSDARNSQYLPTF